MSNYLKNIAIVGAGGNSGKFMTDSLLATGKHNVTALTRHDSKTPLPTGVKIAKVDYNDHSALVAALKGQDALVITLGTRSPADQQTRLIRAAVEAGVQWVLPNEWAPDTADASLCQNVSFFASLAAKRTEIEEIAGSKLSWIGVSCSFWYEWSLAIEPSYGFDLVGKKATFFDDGMTKITTSTWPQVGRAVAALLSLPIQAEAGGDAGRCLESFRNKMVYVSSFTISQKDMFESVLRVTGDKAEDWTISHEDSKKRWQEGEEAMKTGDRNGFVRYMYSPIFFPGGAGNVEKTRGTQNALLDLPKEDIDEATKVAIERAKNPMW